MGVEEIKGIDNFRKIINSDQPVVIDFWATWCGPCRFISPILEQLSETAPFKDAIKFYKVDVDDQADISQECGIRAMPTFQVYKKGEKDGELVGANQAGLHELLAKAIGPA